MMLKKLQSNNELPLQDIQEIVSALQIASGNATGVGKIRGILQYLEHSPIHILSGHGVNKIINKFELAKLVQSLDKYIDITSDKDFKDYF